MRETFTAIVYSLSAFISLFFAAVADVLRGTAVLGTAGNITRDVSTGASSRKAKTLQLIRRRSAVKKANACFAFLSFLPLYIVSAIRYKVGTDYAGTYRVLYGYVYSLGYHFTLSRENLYALLNRLAMFYSGRDYTGVFALSSLLVCAFVFLGLRNQSKCFCYGVALFILSGFYYWSFNVVRQSIAMAIFIYALRFIRERKPLRYTLCAVLAMGFHSSALMYVPLYFINAVRIDVKLVCVYSALLLFFSSYFVKIIFFFSKSVSVLYAMRYFSQGALERDKSSYSHIFINLCFFILFSYIAWVYDRKRKHSNIWINFQGCALMLSMLTSLIPLASRLSRLFEVVWMISIPCMTGLIKDRSTRLFVNTVLVLCLLAYLCLTYFILGYHDIAPYRTIFNRT